MTSASGSLLFLSKECVVGMALRVDRTYLGAQFASGEGVTLDYSFQKRISNVSQYIQGAAGWVIIRSEAK